jgi:hypothetical protein
MESNQKERKMKKFRLFKQFGVWELIASIAIVATMASAQQTKYSASVTMTDPSVTFGPQTGRQVVKSLQTSCDVSMGTVKFYSRAAKYAITGTNGSNTAILFANASAAVNTNDIVVYVHKDGTVDQTTVASAVSTGGVTLAAAISVDYASGDYLYEVSQASQIVVADQTAGVGTNVLNSYSGEIFVIPGDSPCYMVLSQTTNACLSATVE